MVRKRLSLAGLASGVATVLAFALPQSAAAAPAMFAPATSFPVGTNPRSVAVGDLNGDGRLDRAVANLGSDTVSVLLGDGTGGFGAATSFAAGSQPYSVAIGDLNDDGRPDLAVADDGSASVSVLLGDGTGGFGAPTSFPAADAPHSVAT